MIGQYYDEQLQNLLMVEKLSRAREQLKNFDTLNSLFSSFAGYESKKYRCAKNIVFRMCSSTQNVEKELKELDDALRIFNVLNLQDERANDFKGRLRSDDFYQSLTAYTELVIAKRFADRLGKDNVAIYPKLPTGGFSDVLVKLGTRDVYIEVGNLAESEPEKKIQKILNECAKYLASKSPDSNYLLVLEIDTAEFVVDSHGNIDEVESIKKLDSEFDRLCINKLAGFKGFILMDEITSMIRFKDSIEKIEDPIVKDQVMKSLSNLPKYERELLELIETPPVDQWINSCRDQILKGSSIITSILGGDSKTRLIEIHSQMTYPSTAALKERDSFINHVIRHITAQLEDHQLQPDGPNIIIVQGSNWTFWIFSDLGGDLTETRLLYERIMDFLDRRKEKYLSGISLFNKFSNPIIFIPNRYASSTSKLDKNEIEKLGMHILPLP